MTRQIVYVGTYSEPILFGNGQVLDGKGRGIYAFALDPATGALAPVGIREGVRNSSYLAFDPARRFLFCVNEFKEYEGKAGGAVSAFALDPETGALRHVNTRSSHGPDPCHLVVDATGRFVLVANYSSGSVSVLPVGPDGALGEACCVVQHAGSSVHPSRQTGPHAHAVTIDRANRYVFVSDLGLDRVMIYAFDARTGSLTPNPHQPWVATSPGAGPRQLVMHPGGAFAYLINELASTITAYRYDAGTGSLAETQTLSSLPAGFSGQSTCAELQIAPSGRFLYGSNRGHDSIAIFAIDEAAGGLTALGHEGTQGHIPRNFDISPDGAFLAAANQVSNTVVMFRVDRETGLLAPTGTVVEAGTPVCVRFM